MTHIHPFLRNNTLILLFGLHFTQIGILIPYYRQPDGLTPCRSYHLINAQDISKRIQHGELIVTFRQIFIDGFAEPKWHLTIPNGCSTFALMLAFKYSVRIGCLLIRGCFFQARILLGTSTTNQSTFLSFVALRFSSPR